MKLAGMAQPTGQHASSSPLPSSATAAATASEALVTRNPSSALSSWTVNLRAKSEFKFALKGGEGSEREGGRQADRHAGGLAAELALVWQQCFKSP